MPRSGESFIRSYVTTERPEAVMQRFISGTANTRDYTITQAGSNTLILTRKYWPTWVIVVAVIGILFFLIGLAALLYRETETLTINVSPGDGGTQVQITGVSSPELVARLNSVISSLPAAA
jgi:hypothetical protein